MNNRIIDLAILAAKKNICPDNHRKTYRHGSVIFRKKRIINVGHNSFRTHTKSNVPHKTIHSEFDTILGVDKDLLAGSSILVIRLSAYNKLTMSRPCPACLKLISAAKIKNIYYSDFNGNIIKEKVNV